jgi:extradiol dioxygenase family protein
MKMSTVFHCSFPVRDLASTRAFYGDVLGCTAGRTEADRIDFDFFGHHIVAQCRRRNSNAWPPGCRLRARHG